MPAFSFEKIPPPTVRGPIAPVAKKQRGLIVQLLTRAQGRHAGLVRGGQGRKLRAVFETGNRVAATWKARLAEHLGLMTGELLTSHAARIIEDPARLVLDL